MKSEQLRMRNLERKATKSERLRVRSLKRKATKSETVTREEPRKESQKL